MYMTFFRERLALDGSKEQGDPTRNVTIPEGRHEVERVSNPYGYQGDWFVLKGTLIGGTEESLRHWEVRPGEKNLVRFEGFEVVIEE